MNQTLKHEASGGTHYLQTDKWINVTEEASFVKRQ